MISIHRQLPEQLRNPPSHAVHPNCCQFLCLFHPFLLKAMFRQALFRAENHFRLEAMSHRSLHQEQLLLR
jgi:hypothetical protein